MATKIAFFLLILSLGLSLDSPAETAEPLLAYRGTLLDPGGKALKDGKYSLVFSIYETEDAKTPQWTESHQVDLAGGSYDVLLGGVTPIPQSTEKPLWFEVRQAGEENAPRSKMLLAIESPIGTEQIKDRAITAAKLEEGLGLKLAYNSYSDSSTTQERTEVVLREYALPAHSFSSMLIVQVTGEAYAFEGYLNVYIGGTLEKTMHVRTSDAPWSPYLGGFGGCTIVKRNLDWSKPIEIRVVGYLPVSMPGLDPPQQITCSSLTVMGS
jgi:hypothetical protein